MKVNVWNDNAYDHVEMFRGDKIEIPAGKCIPMDEEDAIQFRGQYTPIRLGNDDQPMPQSFKMIRIEKLAGLGHATTAGFPCQACGKIYESQRVLDAHTDEQHLDQMEDQKVAEKRRGRPRKEVV